MATLYFALVGYTAGTLLYLFLMVLILGHRRRRALERVLFFLFLALFLASAGSLLHLNSFIHYAAPPESALRFAMFLILLGSSFLPAFLVHAHAELWQVERPGRRPAWFPVALLALYLPAVYCVWLGAAWLDPLPLMAWLDPLGRLVPAQVYWLDGSLLVCVLFQVYFARRAPERPARRFFTFLAIYFGAVLLARLWPLDPGARAWLAEPLLALGALAPVVPGAVLAYLVVRRNFLGIGAQRNLVYAVTAAFLALLYLAVARRASVWLEPFLPPEATISVLLFALVFLFEPLQRRVGRALHGVFRLEVDRLQRLTGEIHEQARHGELARLVEHAERRIAEEFSLAAVRITVRGAAAPPAPAEGKAQRFVLRKHGEELGTLEACYHGAFLSGETYAALEFLAEQLPAAVDLCRLIEEKLRLERELAERERLALVGQLAASISHNLKNPLGAMKTILQVQLENPGLPEPLRNDCRLVVAEIDRLTAKLAQILRYARPAVRPGGPACGGQPVAAAELAGQTIGLLRREAERRKVAIAFDAPAEELFVHGTEESLNDVLANLLVNALEAVPAGGQVRVRLYARDAQAVLEVADNGPGVPAELRDKLFQPFFTTKPAGTGLGLAIVERRLAEMGGRMAWESPAAEGRGTRFTVTLPLAKAEARK